MLSFIIPLYNCAPYIGQCIDSILGLPIDQDDYEIIVVDDGSTDHGATICEEYQQRLGHLKLIRQQNAGASAARNRALEAAQGEWIWFVDADDRVMWKQHGTAGGYELVELLNSTTADVICFDYQRDFGTDIESVVQYAQEQCMQGCTFLLAAKGLYLWNKIFRRRAIGGIRFVEGTKNIEDMYFDMKVIVNLKHLLCVPVTGYSYNQVNMTSTSRNSSLQNLRKLSDDTQLIHSKIMGDMRTMNGPEKAVFNELLSRSGVGYLYSLITRYPGAEIKANLKSYKAKRLYPLEFTSNGKYNIFLLIANRVSGVLLLHGAYKLSNMIRGR